MAMDWVRLGRIPYIGSWDNNFPGVICVHAVSILLFGTADVAYRLLDLFLELAFGVFLYRFLLRWFKPHGAALAAVLYVAVYVSGAIDVYGKQDTYGMMAQLAGIALYLPNVKNGPIHWRSAALGGLVAGISLAMRPTFLLFIGISALFILWSERKHILQAIGKSVLCCLCAMVVPAIIIAYYSTIPHGVEALYNSLIRFNTDLYVSLDSNSKLWWEILRSGLIIPLCIVAIAGAKKTSEYLRRRPFQAEQLLYATFVLGIFGIVLLMGKYYRYHLAPFFMLLVPLTAAGLEEVLSHIRGDVRRHITMLVLVFFCTFLTYNPTAPLAFSLGLLTHRNPFSYADSARRTDTVFGAVPESKVRQYVDRYDSIGSPIEVCSFSPFLRDHLQHRPVGAYITFHPLAFRTDAKTTGTPQYTDYQQQWQRAYVDTLRTVKPKFIIMARHMPFWYIRDVYDDCLHYLPGFDSLLSSSYRYDTTFGGFQIYRRIGN